MDSGKLDLEVEFPMQRQLHDTTLLGSEENKSTRKVHQVKTMKIMKIEESKS